MTDTNNFKIKLEAEKKLLIEELKGLGRIVDLVTGDWEAVPEEGEQESDDNDLGDRFEDYEQRSATLNTLELRLKDVNDALKKIASGDSGKFGLCEVSGEPIENDRLEANPAARTCKKHMNG